VGEFSLTDNAALTGRDRMEMVRFGLIDPGKATNYAAEVIGAYTVKATGPGALAASLSGGNLQKFIMGREILQRPEALAVCQPTWGVDAGAAAAIHQAIIDLAARGTAVMVISQDLDELLTLCDTIAVINLGRLSQPMKVGEVSIEEIGLLMGGVHGDPAATVEMTEALHAHPA
jgi:simple sugar transport system ATP-binding protein